MKKTIELLRTTVEYDLKISKRARRMRLVIYGGGDFSVIVPAGSDAGAIERFIFKNEKWIVGKIEKFKAGGGYFQGKNKEDYLQNKKKAGEIAAERVAYFSKIYGLKAGRIAIKDQKTRWGSCSKRGNLNFNYRIVFLPPRVLDYVIVHELCHIKEFNHSQRFWDLVAKAIPDYPAVRQGLKPGGPAPLF